MPATLAGNIGEQLCWQQPVAVVGEEGVYRLRLSLPAAACSSNHHTDTTGQIDTACRNTPVQQAPGS